MAIKALYGFGKARRRKNPDQLLLRGNSGERSTELNMYAIITKQTCWLCPHGFFFLGIHNTQMTDWMAQVSMRGSQGQFEEFERKREADHCVDKFNFPQCQLSSLLSGLCYNHSEDVVVLTVTWKKKHLQRVQDMSRYMSTELLIVQRYTSLWFNLFFWQEK